MADTKKTIRAFVRDIKREYGWNAAIGFWYGFTYRQYQDDLLEYNEALDYIGTLATYTGSAQSNGKGAALNDLVEKSEKLLSDDNKPA